MAPPGTATPMTGSPTGMVSAALPAPVVKSLEDTEAAPAGANVMKLIERRTFSPWLMVRAAARGPGTPGGGRSPGPGEQGPVVGHADGGSRDVPSQGPEMVVPGAPEPRSTV